MITAKDHLIIRVCHARDPDERLIRQGAGGGVNHGVVCRVIYARMGGDPSKILQHLIHLGGVNVHVIITHPVACLYDAIEHEHIAAVCP